MKILLILCTIFAYSLHGMAQFNLNKVKKDAEKIYKDNTGSKSGKLTNDEVIKGLREALTVGTNNSSEASSKLDGFNKNPKIRIPFPPEAEKVKTKAIQLGMKGKVDKFETTLNRAAEEAAKEAAPIFIAAIKGMSIGDGFKILKGNDNAATEYLKGATTAELTTKFAPIVKKAIDKVELTKYWTPLINTYNRVPGVEKQNPDLEKYVTERAIIGLFLLIADEEKNIRKNPGARINDILKKVFGGNG